MTRSRSSQLEALIVTPELYSEIRAYVADETDYEGSVLDEDSMTIRISEEVADTLRM